MSASSRSSSPPADQVASSLEQGRKLILQLVCCGYLLYLVSLRLLVPEVPLSPLGAELITGYMCTATLVLSLLPGVRFRPLTSLATVVYLPYAALNLLSGLGHGRLPTAELSWMPLLVVLCFSVLGARMASVVTGVLLVTLTAGIALFASANRHAGHPQFTAAWLAQTYMLAVLTVLCALIARSVEERLQVGLEARVQLAAARIDALTGVMGRAAAELYLQEGLDLARQERLPLSLLICDLDSFKSVNDRYGHPVGDAVLKAAARRLKRHTGSNGRVGRWGGEEFVVILPNMAKTEALTLAERLRKAIAGNDLAGLTVTASFGVASYRSGDGMAELFERADQRLYEAKNGGRNAVRG